MFSRLVSFSEGLLSVIGVNGAYHTRQSFDQTVTDDYADTSIEIDCRGKPCICAYVVNHDADHELLVWVDVQVAGGAVWFPVFTGVVAVSSWWRLTEDFQRNVAHRARLRVTTGAEQVTAVADLLISAGHF